MLLKRDRNVNIGVCALSITTMNSLLEVNFIQTMYTSCIIIFADLKILLLLLQAIETVMVLVIMLNNQLSGKYQ